MGSRFEWSKGRVLTQADFEIDDKIAYIYGLILSQSVTLIYSPPKQGKTWLGYALARRIARSDDVDEIHYLDMDNSISTLKDRGVDQKIVANEAKIFYYTRSTIGCDPLEYLQQIAHGATRGAYTGITFFLDTTKDFVDTDNKSQSTEFMRCVVRIRDAGGTVIILHHATKNQKTISGNQVFINTPDNVFGMKQTGKSGTLINYQLIVTHARGLVEDCKYSVDTETLDLLEYDAISTAFTDDEKKQIKNAIFALKNTPEGMSRSKLITQGLGFELTSDRRGKRIVEELTGKYWRVEEIANNKHIYHYIKEA